MSSSSSSSEEEEEPGESLATAREKRCNAGARMGRLLEAEDEDDFYKTTYGGFEEEAEDNDYASEASVADDVDSDFDIDEADELKSDGEDDGVKRKRQGVNTKAYKEPKKPKTEEPKKTLKEKKSKTKPKQKQASTVQMYHSPLPKALRKSTSQKSAETVALQEERAVKAKMMKQMAAKKNVSEVRRLTQEELLAEAKITEEINLKALETYQRMELEKKRARGHKTVFRGPLIKYISTTMPLIEEMDSPQDSGGGSEMEINVDEEENVQAQLDDGDLAAKRSKLKANEKCSRTFITFTDELNFKEVFSKKKSKSAVKHYCPVTRSPAKYFDPITQLPYANSQAFNIIREAHAQHVESNAAAKRSKPNPPQTISV